jgi:hypothetical protein
MNKCVRVGVVIFYLDACIFSVTFVTINALNSIIYGMATGDFKTAVLRLSLSVLVVLAMLVLTWVLKNRKVLPI